ncbi:lipid II:glycine glycyltransferase FemX [Benzoatithermus flavus]|uniref:GNAT family N-acetyltransferase n=1 Tax=Benzoatithermus flavus TaxID=3108223 RepID=A0ABU8XKM3_9PROT
MSARLARVPQSPAYHRLARRPIGSLFSSPGWLAVLTSTYGFEISASMACEADNIEAAILYSRISDLRGERIVSLPFSDYCDPLVDNAQTWRELVQPILDFGLPVTLRCLRSLEPLADERFSVVGQGLWHGIDLTRPEEEIWAALPSPARQNVRKAQRSGVVIRETRAIDDIRTFHRLHCHVRKSKYRLLAQPLAFFENLHAAFAADDSMTLLLAEVAGEPVAGILFLEWCGTLYYKFNASTDQAFRPNDLLLWEGIRLGRQHGLEWLDLGFSDVGQPGLVRYKRKYATEERLITVLRWWPQGYLDRCGEEAGRTLGRITHLLTDPAVPDAITRAAGDELYRFFC